MRLLLPDGVTPTSTNGGTISGNAIEWSLGAVGAGDGGRRIVEVDIDDVVPEGSLLQARASLSSGNVGETTQRASLPLTTLTTNPLRLTVTPPDEPVQPGQQVTYSLEIEKTRGPANIASPTTKVVLPGGINSFRPSSTSDPDNVSNCGAFCNAGEILIWTPSRKHRRCVAGRRGQPQRRQRRLFAIQWQRRFCAGSGRVASGGGNLRPRGRRHLHGHCGS